MSISCVNILHISDLHFGSEQTTDEKFASSPEDKRNSALDEFIKEIKKLQGTEWQPNIIVVTGDIAYHYDDRTLQQKDYKKAEKWFKELMSTTNVTAEKIILCPGNHDVDQQCVSGLIDLKAENKANEYLTKDDRNPKKFLQRCEPFNNYVEFCKSLGIVPLVNGFKDVSHLSSYLYGCQIMGDINFIVLNSAWNCRNVGDDKELLLGSDLVLDVQTIIKEKSGIKIALVHHPRDYLNRNECNTARGESKSAYKRLTELSDIILTGHEHGESRWLQAETGCHIISCGSTYATKKGCSYNSFQIIKIQINERTYKRKIFEYSVTGDDVWTEKPSDDVYRLRSPSKDQSTISTHTPPPPPKLQILSQLPLVTGNIAPIYGRDTYISELCEKLQKKPDGKRPCIFLTGTGIGKTEILNKMIRDIRQGKISHNFTHICFIPYMGTMDGSLVKSFKIPEYVDLAAEDIWAYLGGLATDEKNNVLLLIDDVRDNKENESIPNHEVEKLLSLNIAVLAAFRLVDLKVNSDRCIDEAVPKLDAATCAEIFNEKVYGKKTLDLPPNESAALNELIRNADHNPLVVTRFGAIAAQEKCGPAGLVELFKKMSWNICITDDITLKNVIKLIYDFTFASVTDNERNLLEAFSLFPRTPLPEEKCKEWLALDAGIDKRNLPEVLQKLTKQAFLMVHTNISNTLRKYSMHQLVKEGLFGDDTKITFERHVCLVKKLVDEICVYENNIDANSDRVENAKLYESYASYVIQHFLKYRLNDVKDLPFTSFIALVFFITKYYEEVKNREKARKWSDIELQIFKPYERRELCCE